MKIKLYLLTFAFFCYSYASDYDDDYEDFVGYNDDSYATVATPSTSNSSFNSPNVYSSYKAPAQYYSGFYYESSLGLGYSKFSVKQYKTDWSGWNSSAISGTFDKISLSGFGPAFDFKFGGIISSLVAIYGSFDYSAAFGSLKYRAKTSGVEEQGINYSSVSLYRVAFGAGGTLFPFRDFNNPLYGFFFGAQFNVAITTADDYYDFKQYGDDYWMYDNIDVYAVGFSLEVGKVWNLGGKWNLGIQGKFMFDSPYSSSEITSRSSDDDADYDCFTFSINFIVIRK